MRKLLIKLSVCFAVVFVIIATTFTVKFIKQDFGISNVKIVKSITGDNSLAISYFDDITACKVRNLTDQDFIEVSEKQLDPTVLGEYQIAIWFSDTSFTKSLTDKYPVGEILTLKNVPKDCKDKYKICLAYPPSDAALVIYIGSDEPFDINAQEFDVKNKPFGTVRINL